MLKDPKEVVPHFSQATDIILEAGSRASFINPKGPWGTIVNTLPKPLERSFGGGKSRHANPDEVGKRSGVGALKEEGIINSLNLTIHFGETGNAPDDKQTKELAKKLQSYFNNNGVGVITILQDPINGRADIEVKLPLLENGLNAENRDEDTEAKINQNTLTVARNLAAALQGEINRVAQARAEAKARAEAEAKSNGNVPMPAIS